MAQPNESNASEGITSLLDTDLYKLTMQRAVLKYFPDTPVEYTLTNRTPHKQLNRRAFNWLAAQITKLGTLHVTDQEIAWLNKTCPYLGREYLQFLKGLKLRPSEQVDITFTETGTGDDDDTVGDLHIRIHGIWAQTILYEVPILALTSEAYFKFVDTDWTHDSQLTSATAKGLKLIEGGCAFSEFGTRRRRDRSTHEMVVQGLVAAQREARTHEDWKGSFTGTSNVHLAMRFNVTPIGTVAHEWFMAIAAITDSYAGANELALRMWMGTFGWGVLAVALTDTFGTAAFLRAFATRVGAIDGDACGSVGGMSREGDKSLAEIFTGVRQDSGDPLEFIKLMENFYASQDIAERKTVVFSDSLNVEKCIQYKLACDATAHLRPSFGVGTFFTNDFVRESGEKSAPMNIVIKLSSAKGKPAVKLSDDKGKVAGDEELIARIKKEVKYEERGSWADGDEGKRWT